MNNAFLKIIRGMATCVFIGVIIGLLGAKVTLAETTLVTLQDGKKYEIETVNGLPTAFKNEFIRVHDLGVSIRIALDNLDAPPYVRVLKAELLTKGEFTVTVTTPLDTAACARLEAIGPGRVMLNFFPQADYPRVWEGIDQPGVHWFPFHFVFEDKHSEKRFEFTQWAQIDYKIWKPVSEQIEKDIQRIRETKQKK